ncbi:MAG TPA: type II toxin-antitoxin system RelE/ParE family toxin [Usitatibacter sp.]|nr:type II toxin-antitoxin system RelE/ParE family toxin [Usitatibacter sp.]
MSRITYAPGAIEDLDRLADFIRDDPPLAQLTERLITDALSILEKHPLIGYEVESGWRQLVISRGKSGYLALYEYDPVSNRVIVHAIRHQRESGFDEES